MKRLYINGYKHCKLLYEAIRTTIIESKKLNNKYPSGGYKLIDKNTGVIFTLSHQPPKKDMTKQLDKYKILEKWNGEEAKWEEWEE